MGSEGKCYRVNTPRIVHETVGGETLAIDSTTGFYYSLRDSGSVVWELVDRGSEVDAIVAALPVRYDVTAEVAAQAVRRLLGELEAEGLVARCDPGGGRPVPAPAPGGPRDDWREPAIEKFTDMERLMLIDPIHMVDDEGWPHVKKSPPRP